MKTADKRNKSHQFIGQTEALEDIIDLLIAEAIKDEESLP